MGEQFILWWNGERRAAAWRAWPSFLIRPTSGPRGVNDPLVERSQRREPFRHRHAGLRRTSRNPTGSFLDPGAWVQGKLRFGPSTASPPTTRWIYGPGVLDVSRFNYLERACAGDEGLYALTSTAPNAVLDHFHIDGIMILDHNHAAIIFARRDNGCMGVIFLSGPIGAGKTVVARSYSSCSLPRSPTLRAIRSGRSSGKGANAGYGATFPRWCAR